MTNGSYTLQNYIDIAKSSKMSICVLDQSLSCVYGNSVIKKGASVVSLLRGVVNLPIHSHYEDTITIDDSFYYIRIYVIADEPRPRYYLCETIDCAYAWDIFNKSAPEQLAAAAASLRYRAGGVSELASALDCKNNAAIAEIIPELRLKIGQLLHIVNGFGDYIDMMLSPEERVLFDVGRLCESICRRCNMALAQYDRCIAMPLCDDGLYIYADGRRTVTALLNAVFNALAYSPADVIPQIIAYCDDSTASAIIKLIQTPFEAPVDNSSVLYGPDFGLSLALVRRFAALAGGSAQITRDGENALIISLPIASDNDMFAFRLEQSTPLMECAYLDDYIDDFIGCCLTSAVHKNTGNIQ